MTEELKEELRKALYHYMVYSGCGCCRDDEETEKAEKILAELLDVERYDDDSGYKFAVSGTLD
jgi:hypothetical protein